jgi:threonine dehydrogenase-like Zn-dependent dehydrogenase
VSIEVTGLAPVLNEAIRVTCYASRVVTLGFFQEEAHGLYLGEEFHHNRIQLICSQISNVDPGLHFRWDRLRLIDTIMKLQVEGSLNLKPLISHVIPFKDAAEAFRLIDSSPEEVMAVVLEFPQE